MGLLAILRLILTAFQGVPPFDRPDIIFPLGFLGFFLLLMVVGWGVRSLRRVSAPLDNLLEASSKVADGDFSARVEEKGLQIREATCPLVHVAHRAVKKLVGEGFHPVIIGKRDHVEVRGLTEDLDDFDVVLSETDVFELKPSSRYGIAAQTTQPIERVRALVGLIEARFPEAEVRFIDTVCQPTKQRQQAAVDLARQCDVVIVIGGAHSNNTHELVKTSQRYCSRVYHVQTAEDLAHEWFRADDIVGITAGTSTPDSLIHEVERRLRHFAETHLWQMEIGATL